MFLHPLMLAGLGGAVLPLVLHLLNRARYRTFEWGAMMFLPGVEGRQEQSTKIKQLLLLLLRMAVVAVLAIALARPVVGAGWTAIGSDSRCCAVILLDTSASMGYTEGGQTRLDAARRAALAVLAGLKRTDEVNLIMLGESSGSQPDADQGSDLQSAASRLADLKVSTGRADIATGLATAESIFDRSKAPNRMIVLICDRQAASWKNVTDDFATTWHANVDHAMTEHRDPSAKFVVISVGSEACENLAIDRITPPPPPLVRDLPIPVEVVVHNYGRTPALAVPLTLEASGAGRASSQSTVDVPAGAATTVTFSPQFNRIGSHIFTARLESKAGLSFDDQAQAAVSIVDPLKVCIITGEGTRGVRNQSDYLRLALAPYKTAGEKGADLAEVHVINAVDPWPADLSTFGVIALADVPRLDAQQSRRLEQFVYGGGGLLITPGDLLQADAYDQAVFRDGAGLLPAKILNAGDAPTGVGIAAPDLSHPIFHFLRDRSDTPTDVIIHRRLTLDSAGLGRVIVTCTDGAPLLVEKSFGRGRVLLVTTTLGTDWTTLPRSSFFLPMVQSAVRYVAGGDVAQRNVSPGEPIEARSTDAIGDKATVVSPDGSRESIDLLRSGTQQIARTTETNKPGVYEIRLRTSKGDASQSFVVQDSRDESDLTPLPAERWDQLQKLLGFSRLDAQSADLSLATAGRRGGRELWLLLTCAAVCLLLAESAVSRLWSAEG